MVINEFLKDKIKGIFSGERRGRDDLLDPLDDFETRDKQLKAMRRMRRRQMDIVEKEELRKNMSEFQRAKDKKDFVGESLFNSSIEGGERKPKKVKSSFMGGGGFFGKGGF